ncbi:MAG: DUF1611 domain-containing protein [Blastocatellia bacterium]|nr:DUF1611 domain-containing protein [Blastocatellia bacterium]
MDGTALILCEGAFGTPAGKTAHGLVRFTERYKILGVIDSKHAGCDAGVVLDGQPSGVPVFGTLSQAFEALDQRPEYLVLGFAPTGDKLSPQHRQIIRQAIHLGMNIDSGLRLLLTEDAEFPGLAQLRGIQLRDVRKPVERRHLHTFTGRISEVNCTKIAVLGTDALVGKRTTAVHLRRSLRAIGLKSILIGTGQTAWLQGMKYCVIADTVPSYHLTGEIEHMICEAYEQEQPDVIILEGQGSLTDPLRPGGLELLCAGRPDAIIIQHAPKRKFHTHLEKFPLIPLANEIQALQLLTEHPVIAITLNHEGMNPEEMAEFIRQYEADFKIPTMDVLKDGTVKLVDTVLTHFPPLYDKVRTVWEHTKGVGLNVTQEIR